LDSFFPEPQAARKNKVDNKMILFIVLYLSKYMIDLLFRL
jgi:hypothetical protein